MADDNECVGKGEKSSENPRATSTDGTLKEFIKAFDAVHRRCYYAGLDFNKLEVEINIGLVGTFLFILFIYVVCFFTGWILRKDWYMLMETVLILILNIQGTNKIWIGVVYKAKYYNLFRGTETIYAEFDADERNRGLLKDMVVKLNFILKGMVLLYTIVGGAIILFVGLYALFTRQYFMAFSVFIPYVDYNSLIGYLVTFTVHSMMIVFCCNGYLASDTAFVVTVVPIIGYANSFQNEIVNFNQLLGEPKRNEKLIAEKLFRISKLHKLIVEFEQDAIRHFRAGCLVQISTQAGTILLSIFLGYICGYVQAFSMMVGLVFQITQYCALGTIVTVMNEQITTDIYDIGWHLLSKSQQKTVAFMLHRAQLAGDLSVGQVAPLNMQTYVKIMKTIYSFFAMLVTVMG